MTRACRRLLRQFIKLCDNEKRKRDAKRDRVDAEKGLGKLQSHRNCLKCQVEDARNRLL
jgi:hypothetical protein